jgi:DNA-binding response OmpR family regulator
MNILLVEDDVGIGRFVTRGLTARGHKVTWHREGALVPARIATEPFGAVLLDLGLPDMDGLDLCRSLRTQSAALPVLMLTARDSLGEKLDGFEAGADDYLPKPFAFEELVARLAVLERREGLRPPEPLRFGALAIDPVRREAQWNGESIALDGRGFSVLFRLAEARGAVVFRDDLISSVWGEDSDVTDNALDVNVSALRRRLAKLAAPPTIETFRGRGFRLKV